MDKITGKVIDFNNEFEVLANQTDAIRKRASSVDDSIKETERIMADVKALMQDLGITEVSAPVSKDTDDSCYISELNLAIRELDNPSFWDGEGLDALDVFVSIIAGVIASVIDIVFVGTPEVVKLYRGGENFDGSILTAALRKIGNDDGRLSQMIDWCHDKCTVPYDISALSGVVVPNNHRLRSFAHDPFCGLLFAIVDILLGTATLIDDTGKLRIIVNPKDYPGHEKILAVLYYFGHLISDVCTARGLPIPGFFLTQFFTTGEDSSIAKVAEQMYKDGYDLRHLAAMSTPVIVKNMIIDIYVKYFGKDYVDPVIAPIAEKEIRANRGVVYKNELRLVSDAVCCGGNVLKFFIPPTLGNITALNLPEWIEFIKHMLYQFKYQLRDKTIEQVINNRDIINDNWRLLQELD